MLMLDVKGLSIVLCTLVTAVSQASSVKREGETVLVVGATVLVVVPGVDAAVEVAVLPAHPPTSRTSRTVAARRAVERLLVAGLRKPLQRCNAARVACQARLGVDGELARASQGTGAAAAATSSDDTPCPARWGSGSLASRSAVLAWKATPCLAVGKEANVEVVTGLSQSSGSWGNTHGPRCVRAVSATGGWGGQERSRSACKNPRSRCLHTTDLEVERSGGEFESPYPGRT
jgi:hypothetical protein